jgi:hypothetical protein
LKLNPLGTPEIRVIPWVLQGAAARNFNGYLELTKLRAEHQVKCTGKDRFLVILMTKISANAKGLCGLEVGLAFQGEKREVSFGIITQDFLKTGD